MTKPMQQGRLFLAGDAAHLITPAPGPGGFARGLRDGWVAALGRDPVLARWFAHAYAGVPPDPA